MAQEQEQEQEQAPAQPSLREQVLAHLRETAGEWRLDEFRLLRRGRGMRFLCPLTSLCMARTGMRFALDEYADAGHMLGFTASEFGPITDAADFPRWEPALRAEMLEAAGLPSEEPEA